MLCSAHPAPKGQQSPTLEGGPGPAPGMSDTEAGCREEPGREGGAMFRERNSTRASQQRAAQLWGRV